MTVTELTELLKTECENCGTPEEYLNAFGKMAALPLDADHDEVMLQYGTHDWFRGNGREFEVHLSRTVPDGGDEYININLELFYEPDDWNAPFNDALSNEIKTRPHAQFIAEAQESELFKQLQGRQIKRVRAYKDGT